LGRAATEEGEEKYKKGPEATVDDEDGNAASAESAAKVTRHKK
jgi:hypothetical protein